MADTSSCPKAECRTLDALCVPSFCQWETADLALDIVTGRATPADDPLWASSGALDQQEYIRWANHVCGMACFKMIWAALSGRTFPTMELARAATRYGAYVVNDDGIKGLIYAPFVTFVRDEFDIDARIEVNKTARDLPSLLQEGLFFMASVHPDIRWPEKEPLKKGGHLILVTAADAEGISFHNPSGHTPETRCDAHLSHEDFDRFFAGRGVLILGEVCEE
ncbi:MAG: hypothetical protein PHD48_07065 [Alphaproteobacteria bacterium]|nr:hypothetical protein [Alphaproteobacteria bacterium]